MDIEKFLSDIEKTKIEMFNQDPILVNAIRKVLLTSIYDNGTLRKDVAPNPTRNGALGLAMIAVTGKATISNSDLGEDLRGLAQAVQLLEQGLAQLLKITSKKVDTPETGVNPGV